MTAPAATSRLPAGFLTWGGAAAVSALGSSVLDFGVDWSATGIDARLAGMVVTLVVAPRVALLMLGGAVADRRGPRRLMMCGDALMCLIAAAFAALTGVLGAGALALLAVALLGGIVDAFYLPAAGALPRLFLPDDLVPRGVALVSGIRQLALMAGPPLGALAVMSAGLATSAAADAVSFGAVLVVLLLVRPHRERPSQAAPDPLLRGIVTTLRDVWADRRLRVVLMAIGLLACAVLPTLDLGAALLVRYRGWHATDAGLIETAWFLGTFAVTMLIARTGTHRRPVLAAAVALLGGAAALLVMAGAHTVLVVIAAALLLGVAVAACTSHLAPLLLLAAPPGQVSAYQSVFVLVQMLPLLVTNNLFAAVAGGAGAPAMFVLAAGLVALAGGCLLRSVHRQGRRVAGAPATVSAGRVR